MPSIGWPELLVVLVIALVIFGPKRLPDMGRQLGKGLREFRKATSEIQDHFDLDLEGKGDKKDEAGTNGATPTATAAPPAAAATVESHDVVDGEVLYEETDQPAHPVAG
jgi:sec-independent protein translocase protein TatA